MNNNESIYKICKKKTCFQMMISFSLFIFILLCVKSQILHCNQYTNTLSNLYPTSSEGLFASKSVSTSAVINSRILKGFRLSCNGTLNSFENGKDHLAEELGLSLRDLRIVDPSYPSQIQATIVPRNRVILFSLENVKIVITNNDVYIFDTTRQIYDEEQISVLLNLLKNQIAKNDLASEVDVLSSVLMPTRHQQFAHNILESILGFICNNLASTVHQLEISILSALEDLRDSSKGLSVLQTQIDTLLPLKNQFNDLDKRCAEIKRCLNDILNDDETLEQFYLNQPLLNLSGSSKQLKGRFNNEGGNGHKNERETKKLNRGSKLVIKRKNLYSLSSSSRKKHEHGLSSSAFTAKSLSENNQDINTISLEILLENYLHEIEWISSEITHHVDEIKNTEDTVSISLDLIRNRILKFELFLSISSFVISFGAFITGLFGMNLLNHYETNSFMFSKVSSGLLIVMILLFGNMAFYIKKAKLG
jgi:magnesium transporter